MPETLFLEQHIDVVNAVTLQSFWFICQDPSKTVLDKIRVLARSQAEARKPGLHDHYGPLTFSLANNKGADQPAHSRSLISAFVIRYMKSKETRSDIC